MVLAVAQWIWAASRGDSTSGAKGGFTGAVLVVLVGVVWTIRDRNQAK